MTQTNSFSQQTEVVSLPLTVVRGLGIYSDIELQLVFGTGRFSLLSNRLLVDFQQGYALRTAARPAHCLEGAGTSGDSFLTGCGDFSGMNWRFVERPAVAGEDAFFWLQNDHTRPQGLCLTDNVSAGARRVSMEICSATNRKQLWKLLPSTNGFYNIVSSPSQGVQECLDGTSSARATAVMAPCNGTARQMWLVNSLNALPAFEGRWNTNIGPMMITQKGNTITGTYFEGEAVARRVTGTVTAVTATSFRVNGTWTTAAGTGSFVWVVAEDNSHWRGNYSNGAQSWCGWRDSATAPTPCLLVP